MVYSFSPFVIEALVQTISGGRGTGQSDPPIGLYRSGSEIEGFLLECGIEHGQGAASRVPALRTSLKQAAAQENGHLLIRRALEKVADPRGFPDDAERAQAVRDYLNRALEADDCIGQRPGIDFVVAVFDSGADFRDTRFIDRRQVL